VVPKEHKPPGGGGGGHVYATCTRFSCQEKVPDFFTRWTTTARASAPSALRQRTADFVSDQPKYTNENVPLEDWLRWGSNRTPGTYANAIRSTSKWGGGIELVINSIKEKYNLLAYEKKSEAQPF